MKIDGKTPTQGPEGRRFTTGKAAAKEGGKSFGAELKKAAAARSAPVDPLPASAPEVPSANGGLPAANGGLPAAPPAAAPEAVRKPESDGPAAEEGASFADHMELVKLRLKSGYYTSKTVDDALSDRLTGFFDELA